MKKIFAKVEAFKDVPELNISKGHIELVPVNIKRVSMYDDIAMFVDNFLDKKYHSWYQYQILNIDEILDLADETNPPSHEARYL